MFFLKVLALVLVPLVVGVWFGLEVMESPLSLGPILVALLFLGLLMAGMGQLLGLSPVGFWIGPPANFSISTLFLTNPDLFIGMVLVVLWALAAAVSIEFENPLHAAARQRRLKG